VSRALGLAALTVLELAPHQQVSVAAEAGYTHVGLRLIPVAGQVLPRFNLGETKRRLAETGMKVLDVEVFRLDPRTQVAGFEPTMAQAADLGATELLAHGADPDESRLIQSFGALCDLAQRFQLWVNLEPMPWVEVSTVAKARRIIDASSRKNAALLVDAIHFYRADNTFAELESVAKRYMQLCDAHPGRPADMQEMIRQARGDRLFPGEGALDLKGLMRALPAELPISVEIPYGKPMAALERARRALEATRLLLSRIA
jgi:sugar phosphate isomerase/epimerase